MIKLEEDKIIVRLRNWGSREELIEYMKDKRIKAKCVPKSLMLKKGGKGEPGLEIKFLIAGGRASVFKAKTKEHAIELLGLRTKEDCERVNRELEN